MAAAGVTAYGGLAAAAACCLAALAGCGPDGEQPRALVIQSERHLIDLPKRAAAVATQGGGVVIELRPGGRFPNRIILAPEPGGASGTFERRARFRRARVFYNLSIAEGGSGGPEVMLDGFYQGRGLTLAVFCHTQGEFATLRDGAWCLKHLRTLRPAEAE